VNGETEINGLKMEIFDVIFREPVRIEDERAVTLLNIRRNYDVTGEGGENEIYNSDTL
jgi:hypothetical protein